MVDFKDQPEEVSSIINGHLNSIKSTVKRCTKSFSDEESPKELHLIQDSQILVQYKTGAIKVFDKSLSKRVEYTPALPGKLKHLTCMADSKIAVFDSSDTISILDNLTGKVMSQVGQEPTEFMDFLPSKMNLVTIGNTSLKVWNSTLQRIKSITAYSGRATAFYLSDDQNICIIADSTNRISLYTPDRDFEIYGNFLSPSKVLMMAYISKFNFLITADQQSSTLTVWRTDSLSVHRRVTMTCGSLNCLAEAKDRRHVLAGVYSSMYKGTIMLINTKTFEIDGVLNTNDRVKCLVLESNALYYTEDKNINRLTLTEHHIEHTGCFELNHKVTCIAHNTTSNTLFYATGNKLFAYANSVCTKIYEAECRILCIDTFRNLLFVSGEEKNIKKFFIYNNRVEVDPTVLWGHRCDVKRLKIGTSRKQLVSIDANLNMYIWKLNNVPEKIHLRASSEDLPIHLTRSKFLIQAKEDDICIYHIFNTEIESKQSGYAKSLTHMTLNKSENLMIVYGDNGYVDIWSLEYNHETFKVEFSLLAALNTLENVKIDYSVSIAGLVLSNKEDCFQVIRRKGTIELWSITDLVCLTQTKINKKVLTVAAKQHGFFCLNFQREIVEITLDCLNQESLLAIGPHRYSIFFLKFISDFVENPDLTTFSERFSLWVVLPWKLNILHIFAYMHRTDNLSQAMRSGCSFITTEDKITPLVVALTDKNKEMVNRIIKLLSKSTDKFAFTRIESELHILNALSIPSMPNFYANAFMMSEQPDLEQFGIPFTEPTHSVASKSMMIDNSAFLAQPKEETEGKYLLHQISRFRLDLGMGNKECRKFLTSLAHCDLNEIFRAPIIHEIIQHKWKQVSPLLVIQCVWYLNLTGLFVLHAFNLSIGDHVLLTAIFVINFFFYLYECLQLRSSPKMYLQDVWNWLDFPRVILTFIYCHYAWDGKTDNSSYILVVLLFLVLARGISFFRVFKLTRVFIRMIVKVAINIIPFAGVVIFVTIGFTILSLTMKHRDVELNFFVSFSHIYLLDFGEFSTDSFTTADWIIYSFAMLVNSLVMFNLLIAIMSSTFTRVEQELEVANYKEMALQILEMELIFNRNRSDYKKFIQICTFEEKKNFNNPSEWVGRFKTLSKSIRRLEGKAFELDKESKEMRDSLKEDLNRYFEASTAGIGGASNLHNTLRTKAADLMEELARISNPALKFYNL